NKEKFLISSRNERIFSLAGLFDTWFDKDKNIDRKTFTLLTTEANPLMAEIHNSKKRMPLILQPGTEIEWLHQGNYVPENDLNPVSQDPPAQLNLF
ncbi:MAG: SOS response-associated peptidase family protein, partial [Brumimicrobium sp.]|nr:SOS response-associated peptidase family protein [Brumimicrobium sp.]